MCTTVVVLGAPTPRAGGLQFYANVTAPIVGLAPTKTSRRSIGTGKGALSDRRREITYMLRVLPCHRHHPFVVSFTVIIYSVVIIVLVITIAVVTVTFFELYLPFALRSCPFCPILMWSGYIHIYLPFALPSS